MVGTHDTDTLSQKHTVTGRNDMTQPLHYCGCTSSPADDFMSKSILRPGFGSAVDTVTLDSEASFSLYGAEFNPCFQVHISLCEVQFKLVEYS